MGEVNEEDYYKDKFSFTPKTKIDFNGFIPSAEDISFIESTFALINSATLHEATQGLDFGMDRIKKIHEHLFQDVYEWAGKTRNFDARKFSNGDNLFADPSEFEDIYQAIESDLVDSGWFEDHVKLDKDEFVDKITDVYTKINYAHIFPDGNGRASREYIKDLAQEVGFYLDLNATGMAKEAKKEWHAASKAAFEGDKTKLRALFDKVTKENPLEVKDELKPQELIRKMQALSKYGLDPADSQKNGNTFDRNNESSRIIQEAKERNQERKRESDGLHP